MEEMNNQYIPGDLVMTNGAPMGTVEGVVYKVIASDPYRTEIFPSSGKVLKGTVTLDNVSEEKEGGKGYLFGPVSSWVKHIVPIPLTVSLFNKNGWTFSILEGSFLGSGLCFSKPSFPAFFLKEFLLLMVILFLLWMLLL